MQIYLARNNVQAGPYSLEQVNAMLASQELDFSDLMWHEGMQNWQKMGDMTRQTRSYQPQFVTNADGSVTCVNESQISQNQTAVNHSHQPKWVQEKLAKDKAASGKSNTPKITVINLSKRKTAGKDIAHAEKQLGLASMASRILAKVIDYGLSLLAALPLMMALYHSPKYWEMVTSIGQGAKAYDPTQMEAILNSLPSHVLILSNILGYGLLIAQALLLVRRGQTLGKMATGIRILDKKTNALATFTNVILLRTIVLSVAAFVLMSINPLLAVGLFVADLVVMLMDANRQSIHDKLAGTYVVRADDTQTTPLVVEPTE